MKNVLVTGNLGYVGPAVVYQIRQAYPNANIRGLDTGYFNHLQTVQFAYEDTQIDHQYSVDIRDVQPHHFKDVDVVIHLAAISNDPMGENFSEVTEHINLLASKNCAAMAKEAGVTRFVFASSCSVYGAADIGEYVSEQDRLNPVTTYAKSKIAFEKYLNTICCKNFEAVCLRFATACGASSRLRLDLVLNDFVFSGIQCGKINILSDGSPWRPLIDTQDMARALLWACQFQMLENDHFLSINAGSQENNFQIKDLAYLVQKELGNIEIQINQEASPDKRSYKVGFGHFKKLAPAHQPQITIQQSIQQLAKCAENILSTNKTSTLNKFKRLHILEQMIERKDLNQQLYWTELK